jgi:surfeit locus 1 family protein
MREGEEGYSVITPLEREGGADKVLISRGWIRKDMKNFSRRAPEGVPEGQVTVEGLLRAPFKKNMFTPENRPELGEWYFPDVEQMAKYTGSVPVWIEQTMGKITWLNVDL